MLAARPQHDNAYRRIRTEARHFRQQRIEHRLIVTVALLGTVEREGRDATRIQGAEHRDFRRGGICHADAPASTVRSENRPEWLSSPPYCADSAMARL